MDDLIARAASLGAHMTGEQVTGEYHTNRAARQREAKAAGKPAWVYWTEPGLKITRLRLISDPGFPFWDVSYCHGELADGTPVDVDLPFPQIPKRPGINATIIHYAKIDKVYIKATGIFNSISTLQ